MPDLGWNSVAQAVIVAICSWYVRRGAKKDTQHANQVQVSGTQQILDRLGVVEIDVALVKRTLFSETRAKQSTPSKGIDHGKTL